MTQWFLPLFSGRLATSVSPPGWPRRRKSRPGMPSSLANRRAVAPASSLLTVDDFHRSVSRFERADSPALVPTAGVGLCPVPTGWNLWSVQRNCSDWRAVRIAMFAPHMRIECVQRKADRTTIPKIQDIDNVEPERRTLVLSSRNAAGTQLYVEAPR